MGSSETPGLVTRIVLGVVFILAMALTSPLIFFYKYCVIVLAKIFRPDLGAIFSPQSRFFFPSSLAPLNTHVQFRLSGKLNYDQSVNRFAQNTILRKDESTGKFEYPEFQQRPTMWLGYPFWKNESRFDVHHHFRLWRLEKLHQLQPYISQNLTTAFVPNVTTWLIEFMQVGETPDEHYFCLYFHHSLGDGASICRALLHSVDGEPTVLDLDRRMKEKKTSCGNPLHFLLNAMRSYFRVVGKMIESDQGPWDMSGIVGSRHFGISDVIPLSVLKKLGANYKVSVSAVVLALITGAIRRKMIRDRVAIPEELRCFLPIFTPKHPKGLTNKIFLLDLTLPVGQGTVSDRLALLEAQISQERKNKSSWISHLIVSFCGSIPYFLLSRKYSANGISIFPAPTSAVSICGNRVEDMIFGVNGNGLYALVVNVISYSGRLRFWITADSKISPSQGDVDELSKEILHELNQLEVD